MNEADISLNKVALPFSAVDVYAEIISRPPRVGRKHMAVTGLVHTAVAVADVDQSLWFYRDLLGFTILRDRTFESGDRSVFLGIPGTNVEFEVHHVPAASRGSSPLSFGKSGTGHFCLYVDDVPAFLKQLAQDYPAVANTEIRRIGSGPYAGAAIALIADPNGYHIELLEQAKAESS
jgi:lactoylglutathione lyase